MFGITALPMHGCGGTEARLAPLESPVSIDESGASATVNARARDIHAAVRRSLPRFDLAVLRETGAPAEGSMTFELIGLAGEPGALSFEFDRTDGSPAAARAERTITLRASVGRFGDRARERALAERVARELRTLRPTDAGVAIAD